MYTSLGVFIFFFKQKTAYELRISDWSSDVCSSDLRSLRQWRRCLVSRRCRGLCAGDPRPRPAAPRRAQRPEALAQRRAHEARTDPGGARERKSVGEGKSGSVRVEHGGRRSINKKRKTTDRDSSQK